MQLKLSTRDLNNEVSLQQGRSKQKHFPSCTIWQLHLSSASSCAMCLLWLPEFFSQLCIYVEHRIILYLLEWPSHEGNMFLKLALSIPFMAVLSKQACLWSTELPWKKSSQKQNSHHHPWPAGGQEEKEAICASGYRAITMLTDPHTTFIGLWLETQTSLFSLVIFRWKKNLRKPQWNN